MAVVNVTEDMEDLSIVLEPIKFISGALYHIDNNTFWNDAIPGWMPVDDRHQRRRCRVSVLKPRRWFRVQHRRRVRHQRR